jgi:hypothetical protein
VSRAEMWRGHRSTHAQTDKAIRRGVFHSVPDLIAAIETYLTVNNENPEPFL